MKTFKELILTLKKLPRESKIFTGFATIDKKDDSDKHLKLPEEESTKKKLKEYIDDHISASNPYNKALKDKIKTEKQSDFDQHAANDRRQFAHHHVLNFSGDNTHLKDYTDDSKILNAHLISMHNHGHSIKSIEEHPKSDELKKDITNIDTGVSSHTNNPKNALTKPTIVHSGVGKKMSHILQNTEIGDKVHMPSYTSTSTRHGIAESFAKRNMEGEKHMMHFHLPKGYSKARHVSNISVLPHEHEMVLHKGQTFKKVGTSYGLDREDTPVIHHHFVPEE